MKAPLPSDQRPKSSLPPSAADWLWLLIFGRSTRGVTDGRGDVRPLIYASWQVEGEAARSAFHAVWGQMLRLEELPRAALSWARWVTGLTLLSLVIVSLTSGSVRILLPTIPIAVVLIAVSVLSRRSSLTMLASPEVIKSAWLRACLCPSCTYSLDPAIPPEPDGCTVCPECGAAWRLTLADGSTRA